jgi:hypothetical protein
LRVKNPMLLWIARLLIGLLGLAFVPFRNVGAQPQYKAPGTYRRADGIPWIFVNDRLVDFALDMQPYIDPSVDRTFMPIRGIAEALDLKVDWDSDLEMIDVYDNNHMVNFTLGSNYYWWDGRPESLPYPVQTRTDRSFVPLVIILQAWHIPYRYEGSTNAIYIGFTAAHQTYPPDALKNESPYNQHAVVLSCRDHGYDADPINDDWKECPIHTFFLPSTYRSFGHEMPKMIVKSGLAFENYWIAYLNEQSLIHGGFRVPTYGEAWSATLDQVMFDMTAAEMIGGMWKMVEKAGSGTIGMARNWTYGAMVPETSGWAYPPGGQSMSEAAIRWQASVSDQAYRLIKYGARNTHTWSIMEFGLVTERGALWFDSGDLASKIVVDAKYINPKWLNLKGPFAVFGEFQQNMVMKDLLDAARRQLYVVGDEWLIHWRFNSNEALEAWLSWVEKNGFADELKRIIFTGR